MKKMLLIGLGVLVLVGNICMFVLYDFSWQIEAAQKELQPQCDQLTKFDSEEHVFQPVLGRIGYKRYGKNLRNFTITHTSDAPLVVDGKTYYSYSEYQITFDTEQGQFVVGRERTVDRDVSALYWKHMNAVIKNSWWSDNYIYGICAYQDDYSYYNGKIQSFSLLKKSLF